MRGAAVRGSRRGPRCVSSSWLAIGRPAARAAAPIRSSAAGTSSARAAIRSANARNSSIVMPARPLYLAPSNRVLQLLQDRRRVIVERQQMHAPGLDVGDRSVQCVEVVRLPPQMHPHVAGPGRRHPARSAARCQAVRLRSPGSHDSVTPWNAVVMPLASNCGSVSRNASAIGKSTPGPRLDLTFERVTVDVDDPRQHQQSGRVEAKPAAAGPADASIRPSLTAQIGWPPDHPAPAATGPPVIRNRRHAGPSHGSKTICTRGVG